MRGGCEGASQRIVTGLAALRHDAETADKRPPEGKPGGPRNFPIAGGHGFTQFLTVPGRECVQAGTVVWNG
ncbi:hypothetical protein GCM10009549_40240 [Streptomyces thermoalcalitolerans]|uniref:Uncharacterized protein n=1 Tax=Streptomyces thermoalcalitolerans TaxID=65605 RepID=A0ABN1P2C1_9ACTN